MEPYKALSRYMSNRNVLYINYHTRVTVRVEVILGLRIYQESALICTLGNVCEKFYAKVQDINKFQGTRLLGPSTFSGCIRVFRGNIKLAT